MVVLQESISHCLAKPLFNLTACRLHKLNSKLPVVKIKLGSG